MTDCFLQLRRIVFSGPKDDSAIDFVPGVNVICGASDTGKSFLAESIDFMLGGSELREIPERDKYGGITLELEISSGASWLFMRSTSGGHFGFKDLSDSGSGDIVKLKQTHGHGQTDNLSGFLLDTIGLNGKRILKSSAKGTTVSLSFRNLARLIIVQEGEIQQTGSPFWGGQYTLKTAELATIKLLLTGVDDSNVVTASEPEPDSSKQLALIDEFLSDVATEISDVGEEESVLEERFNRLEDSINNRRQSLNSYQRELDGDLVARRELFGHCQALEGRLDEIAEHLARFDLLSEHYKVDIARLLAVQETGSMFAHVEKVSCPLCGALPETQHNEEKCGGNVEAIVQAASAEILKIERLRAELIDTVDELMIEASNLREQLVAKNAEYEKVNSMIRETVAPQVSEARVSFASLVEERARIQKSVELYSRKRVLNERRQVLLEGDEETVNGSPVVSGLPEAVAHSFSMKVASILKAWGFPGECQVHFDKVSSDFVIDGKPRGSRGKGLRAITHAAVTIGLLEYCQEKGMSHPGFVVLDSPLLAYFEPEGPEDLAISGTDLKERFYAYLVKHHGVDSQVIIIENQHPPKSVEGGLEMKVFTGNPTEGRFGFL